MNAWFETTNNPAAEYQQMQSELTPLSRVSYNHQGISLHVYNEGGTYDIWPWSRVNTRAKILGWVQHLCKKTWCDRRLIRDFVELTEANLNANIRWDALPSRIDACEEEKKEVAR